MNIIQNPNTNKFVTLNSKSGMGILKKYVKNLHNKTDNIYSTILDPYSNKMIKTKSKQGVKLLEKYVQSGGSNTDDCLYNIIEDAYKLNGMTKNDVLEEFCKMESNHTDKNIYLIDMHGSEQKYKKYIELRPTDAVILSCVPSDYCTTHNRIYGEKIGINFIKNFKQICTITPRIHKEASSFCMYKNWCPNLNFSYKGTDTELSYQGMYIAHNSSRNEWDTFNSTNSLLRRPGKMIENGYNNLESTVKNLQIDTDGFTLIVITCRNFKTMNISNEQEMFIMKYIKNHPEMVDKVLEKHGYIMMPLELYYYTCLIKDMINNPIYVKSIKHSSIDVDKVVELANNIINKAVEEDFINDADYVSKIRDDVVEITTNMQIIIEYINKIKCKNIVSLIPASTAKIANHVIKVSNILTNESIYV